MSQLTFFYLAIIALYVAVFGEAAIMKFVSRETPTWYVDQFKETWFSRMPLRAMWWLVAALELVAAGIFVASLATGEPFGGGEVALLGWGLLLSALIFTMLCFGLRVAADFAGAANLFFYAVLTMLLWFAVHAVST